MNKKDSTHPDFVAHRGYMECYPENSLMGFEATLSAGASMFELDVQMSSEGQFIVLHDDNFLRTADVSKNVFDLTGEEISQISVHEPGRFDKKFYPTPVPLLTQVMELVSKHPGVTVFVEIKDESLERWGLDRVMDALHNELMPYSDQCVIIGYNHEALKKVKLDGIFRCGWVLTSFDRQSRAESQALMPDYIICNYKKVPDNYDFMIDNWTESARWMLYDIVDFELALHYAGRGVALIETRDIGRLVKHLAIKTVK